MEDYKEIKELLKPCHDIKASDKLRERISSKINERRRKQVLRAWLLTMISLSAVASILLIFFLPSGLSAKKLLAQSMEAIRKSERIEMIADIRTRPVENFRYIDMEEDFVNHRIEILSQDTILKWRIDKGERIAMGNGKEIYTWLPSYNLGWHLNNPDYKKVLGYLSNLLNPLVILENELKNSLSNEKSEYKVFKSGNEITLIVQNHPEGNFDNPYALNSSISESENMRKYIFDKATKRLKRVEISFLSGNQERVVLKIDSINYEAKNKESFFVEKGIKFIDIENKIGGLKGLNAVEAASTILNAFSEWDENLLHLVLSPEEASTLHKDKFKGSKLISVGHAFTSGIGNSIYVPYTLKLADGTIQHHNMALQKTDSGGWFVAGGL